MSASALNDDETLTSRPCFLPVGLAICTCLWPVVDLGSSREVADNK